MVNQYERKLREANLRYNEMMGKYQQLERSIEGQEDKGRDKQREVIQLRKNLEEYQNKIFSYEEKVALLSQELERLTITIKELRLEI